MQCGPQLVAMLFSLKKSFRKFMVFENQFESPLTVKEQFQLSSKAVIHCLIDNVIFILF